MQLAVTNVWLTSGIMIGTFRKTCAAIAVVFSIVSMKKIETILSAESPHEWMLRATIAVSVVSKSPSVSKSHSLATPLDVVPVVNGIIEIVRKCIIFNASPC